MVVTRLAAQREGLAHLCASGFKHLGQQLVLQQELVGQTLVDQDAAGVRRRCLRGHQRTGIVCKPCALVLPQVAAESLFPPGALAGCGNGRKGRNAFEHPRVAQRQRERTVPAHGMAKNPHPLQIHGQVLTQQGQQFVREVALHAPVRGPGGLRGIEVKAGPHAKVPGIGLAGHLGTARAGVGCHQHQAQVSRQTLRTGLGHEGVFVAGQARQVHQRGPPCALQGLGRQVDRELHRQADFARSVLVHALRAAKAGVRAQQRRGKKCHFAIFR